MNKRIEDQTILITGGNSGIGKAAAVQLARLGATVIIACRSAERGAKARDEICKAVISPAAGSSAAGSPASGSPKVELGLVDLSSQDSIRRFADDFHRRFARLDVLIHNAANFDLAMKQPVMTADGVETIFATNHLGPFLMTRLLLETLKASAPSRIITVASKGLTMYPFQDVDFENLNGERKFSPQGAYYQSKQAQVMFTYDLAERLKGTGVTVNCVRVTNVALPEERTAHLPAWMQRLYQLKRKMAITPERQAETYVYLATDPAVEMVTGQYWDENNRPVRSNKNSYNRETWQRLWDASERLLRVPVAG